MAGSAREGAGVRRNDRGCERCVDTSTIFISGPNPDLAAVEAGRGDATAAANARQPA